MSDRFVFTLNSQKNSCIPLNAKMRNLNNTVWSTEPKEVVKEGNSKKSKAVQQPIAKPTLPQPQEPVATKAERGNKEKKPKKPVATEKPGQKVPSASARAVQQPNAKPTQSQPKEPVASKAEQGNKENKPKNPVATVKPAQKVQSADAKAVQQSIKKPSQSQPKEPVATKAEQGNKENKTKKPTKAAEKPAPLRFGFQGKGRSASATREIQREPAGKKIAAGRTRVASTS